MVPPAPTANTSAAELAQVPPYVPEGSCSLVQVSVLAAGCAVAVNVRGEPFTPVTVAVAVCAPTVGPSTQVATTSPCGSVMESDNTRPPPAAVQRTPTPATPAPASFTARTRSATGKVSSMIATWLFPAIKTSSVAAPFAVATDSPQLASMAVLSSIAAMESGRRCVVRGRLPNCLTGDHREPKPTSARRPLSTCSTTVLTPSGSGTVARQPQLRSATLGSIQIRSTSPDRTAACTGGSLYPVAAATSRNTSIPETSHPDPRFVTRPEGPEAARTVASTTSLT